jgi:hypothetical protein
MSELMNKVVVEFTELLRHRLAADVYTTEDSVRYTFFAALLHCGIPAEQVVLESPHHTISRAEIDTLILGNDRFPDIAIEFKYDRANPSGTNQPMPHKAGKALADLSRLLRCPPDLGRYFIYLTDRELARYLASPRNGLSGVFGLAEGDCLKVGPEFFDDRCTTLRSAMGMWPGRAVLHGIACEALPREHHLRVIAVEPVAISPDRCEYS